MKLLKQVMTYELPSLLGYPALLWQLFFLYFPLFILLGYSFVAYDHSLKTMSLSLEQYRALCTSDYLQVILNSFVIASATSLLCLLLAYPMAYFLILKVNQKFRSFLIFSLIIPSWTSLIVQIYAWLFLLNKNGLLSQFFCKIGFLSPASSLLNNYFAILISMISVYLPFMILPIFSVLRKIDRTLLEASADLGANRFETFKRIILPLSLPGVYVGIVLVFLPAFGEFAIPALLGGSKIAFWGNLIVEKFLRSHDWASGAALALLGVFFLICFFASWYVLLRFFRIIIPKQDD